MNENESQESVERTEERVDETVVQTPQTDEGGPLGNVTESVTTGDPSEEVVERSSETVTERSGPDVFDNDPKPGEDTGRDEFSNTEEMQSPSETASSSES